MNLQDLIPIITAILAVIALRLVEDRIGHRIFGSDRKKRETDWEQRANHTERELDRLQVEMVGIKLERKALEDMFRGQVMTLLTELEETRNALTATQMELSQALDELDRLRNRMDGQEWASQSMRLPDKQAQIRVLAVWPGHEDDPLNLETESLDNSGLDYTPLLGNVTRREIIKELRRATRAHRYNVLHVGSHGKATEPEENSAGGILLSDGDLVPASWWGQIAGAYQVQAAVLMVCRGDDVADALRREGVLAVISASRDLPDSAAISFSFALYENLAEGMPLPDAVVQATWVLDNEQSRLIRLHGVDPWTNRS